MKSFWKRSALVSGLVLSLLATPAQAQTEPALDQPAPAPATPEPAQPSPARPMPGPRVAPPAGTGKRDVGFLLRMNFDFGGTKLAEVKSSDGSTEACKAGGFVTFAAGLFYHPVAPWTLEGTVGYKFDSVSAGGDSVKISRVPVDVIASFTSGRHRFGAGPTLHTGTTVSCSIAGLCNGDLKYDNAVGGILQYGYGVPFGGGGNGGLDMGVRVTAISYKGTGLTTLDGNCFSFFFGAWL